MQVVLLRPPHNRHEGKLCNSAFSRDGSFIFTGGNDGQVYCYDARMESVKEVPYAAPMSTLGSALKTASGSDVGLKHNAAITAVAWHPTAVIFASGCTSLCLWTPAPASVA